VVHAIQAKTEPLVEVGESPVCEPDHGAVICADPQKEAACCTNEDGFSGYPLGALSGSDTKINADRVRKYHDRPRRLMEQGLPARQT
jgi:hypothetical protein